MGILFVLLCLFLFLCFIGVKITQPLGLVLKEDEKATLSYIQNENHFYIDIHSGYKAKWLNVTDFYLDILSTKINHSAIYFCTSSLDRTLQSHLFSLHKPLAFSQKRVSLSSSA
uniref:Uncharacterized protein n=1 Tax=Nothoprocta perdicaria TaxID=30464 RepID=A0A8C7E8D0_NOTPE